MRSLFFLIACLIFSHSIVAQNHEWAPIGAKWWWSLSDEDPGPAYYYWEVTHEDSFQGEFVKVIDVTFFGYDSVVVPDFDTLYTFSRNDSVFLYDTYKKEYGLLYDFGAEVGDTIEFSTFDNGFYGDTTFLAEITRIVLIRKGSIGSLMKGDVRLFETKYLGGSTSYWSNPYYEGFGSPLGLIRPTSIYVTVSRIRCYYDDEIEFHDYYTELNTGEIIFIPCDYYPYSSTKETIWNHPDFKVYPNPVQTDLNIELPDFVKEGEWYLVDLAGKKVRQGIVSRNQLQINLASIPKGLYVFGAETRDEIFFQKIIKE
jgi:hypothetical protein